MGETLYNVPIVINGDMSGNITSLATDLAKTDGYSVSAVWTGSPVGTIKIQVSRDNTNYFDLPGSSYSTSGLNSAMWEITTANYSKVQLVYVASTGSGTMNAGILGKGDFLA